MPQKFKRTQLQARHKPSRLQELSARISPLRASLNYNREWLTQEWLTQVQSRVDVGGPPI